MERCTLCERRPAQSKKGGLCAACKSWWRYVNLFTPTELTTYIVRRRNYRQILDARLTNLSHRSLRRVK